MASQPSTDLPTRPSFFQSRDRFDAALDAGELDLSRPANVAFRYLMEHTVFDRKADDWGWVTTNATGEKRIARRTGYGERTIRDALSELEDKRMISRCPNPLMAGGSRPDDIRLDVLFRDTPEDAGPNRQETPVPEPAVSASHEPAVSAASYLYEEELTEELAASSPTGQESQDPGAAPQTPEVATRPGPQPSAERPAQRPSSEEAAFLVRTAEWCCPALKIPILAAFAMPMKNRAFRAVSWGRRRATWARCRT